MKSLYQVVDTKTRKVIQDDFESKEEAKVVRNKYNEENNGNAEGDAKPRYIVARGKDHPHGATDGYDHTKRH